jgi:YHS domain-containing protein
VLGGYDLVAYHLVSKPVKGLNDFKTTHMGYTFLFASKQNLLLFEEAPYRYLPAYGGFCGWAVSNEFMDAYPWNYDCLGPFTDIESFYLHKPSSPHSRLFFFLSPEPKAKFLEDVEENIRKGDIRWKTWYGDKLSVYKDVVISGGGDVAAGWLPLNSNCWKEVETKINK